MHDALIGYTGFVGSTLLGQRPFDALFRSTNVDQLANQAFDTIVCAGAPGQKWLANAKPDEDAANLQRLMDALAQARCRRLVLYSTIDVFPDPRGVDEDSDVPEVGAGGYGRNRLRLEQFVRQQVEQVLVVRLPALVGTQLRKNALFDLKHRRRLETLDPRARFQFYPMARLWADTSRALERGLACVHLTAEPVPLGMLARQAFGVELDVPTNTAAPASYDLHSRHAGLWNKTGPYLYGRDEVLAAVSAYANEATEVEGHRERGTTPRAPQADAGASGGAP